jgi:calcium-dependent protein kinase
VLLGQGSFGKVYKGVCKRTQQPVAIKIMTKRGLDDRDLEQALHEVEILKSIAGHPNVVKILDVYEDLDTIYIV